MNINEVIKQPEYKFFETDPHLGNNTLFLTFGGSHAYGTNVAGSDIDVRGVAFKTKKDMYGLSNFEQFENKSTDTVIYEFNKFIGLVMSCNPNTIEMLGGKPENTVLCRPEAQELFDNRNLFLSRKAISSFSGYATAQLRRIESAIVRGSTNHDQTEEHLLRACESSIANIEGRYRELPKGALKLRIAQCEDSEHDSEIVMDVSMEGYPLRDHKNLWSDLNNIIKNFGKINTRNQKRDEAHLCKHMMHLIRLQLMCLDILEKEEIITYRENDLELLMAIRNGEYFRNGTMTTAFRELLNEMDKRLAYAAENTSLPLKPDYEKVSELVVSMNQSAARRFEGS